MSSSPTVSSVVRDRPIPEGGLAFDDLSLPDAVRAGIRAVGFRQCTPIQELVLPVGLRGEDVAGQAQTGTGKTAAFLIVLFTRLLAHQVERRPGAPRALVIAPTRELAVQIAQDAVELGQGTGFRVHAVYGGVDYHKQRSALSEPIDILIGTPGRLIDYWKQRAYDLRRVEVLVIDEADRMFDMGFISDLRFLLRRLPGYGERQSMLFSATLSWRVMELAHEFMNEPVRLVVSPEQVTAERVDHLLYHVSKEEKLPLLVGLLRAERMDRVLVFANMKRTAEDVERVLAANGFRAAAITGDVDQRRRLNLLADFREGRLPILIATDVASRGLHIDGVTHVVNFDLPQDPEDYVHRIGRTARAGASGKALSLACEEYVESLEAIERFIGFKLPHVIPGEDAFVTDLVTAHRRHHRGGRPPQRRDRRPSGRRRP